LPVVLRHEGYRFFFYSNEGTPPEPPHIHLRKAGAEAKFWLTPDVALARNAGFDSPALTRLAKIITERRWLLEAAWHDHLA